MREILFRGFHPCEDGKESIFHKGKWIKGEWVYGDVTYDRDLNTAFVSGYDYYTNEEGLQREPFQYEVIPETVGQYTGLEDMFDRKIFEGDIVKYKNKNMQVVFNRGSFYIEIGGWLDKPIADIRIFPFEVIGNIHSNPKLLEQEV